MRFVLFILANAMLFIRPSELIVELAAVEIYRWFILACLAVSLPVVMEQVSLRFPVCLRLSPAWVCSCPPYSYRAFFMATWS